MGDGGISQRCTTHLGPGCPRERPVSNAGRCSREPAHTRRRAATALTVAMALAAACGSGDTSVTPIAGGITTAPPPTSSADTTTSTDTEGSGRSSSTTAKPEAAPTTVTPTSAPSAERLADGTVISAGGYEAKTPAVARGLLLEPKWTPDEQEAADVIHQYLDAMISTVTDKKPDPKVPTSMTDLERPDLNLGGFGADQLDGRKVVLGSHKLGQYWVEPPDAQTAYWVFDLSPLADGRLQVAMCEFNDMEYRNLQTDALEDGEITSAFWDGQLAKPDDEWRIVAFVHQGSNPGRTGCAADS
ncbi:MAG: hypothetical protein R2754_01565 [Microthrixaceae bacterium]